MNAEHERVKAANRALYDALGSHYEDTDGRRSAALETWLEARLAALRKRVGGGTLLDLGTGAGFLLRCARRHFDRRVGVDISSGVLAGAEENGALYAAADCDKLPFGDASFDAVACFAVLHHFHSYDAMFSEIARVLKPGGVFYSDHDMDLVFARRFSRPLALYRKLRKAEHGYERLGIDAHLYEEAEVHSGGVDSLAIAALLRQRGLEPESVYHWYGLNPLADRIFGQGGYPQGWAPVFSCFASKKRGWQSERRYPFELGA